MSGNIKSIIMTRYRGPLRAIVARTSAVGLRGRDRTVYAVIIAEIFAEIFAEGTPAPTPRAHCPAATARARRGTMAPLR